MTLHSRIARLERDLPRAPLPPTAAERERAEAVVMSDPEAAAVMDRLRARLGPGEHPRKAWLDAIRFDPQAMDVAHRLQLGRGYP